MSDLAFLPSDDEAELDKESSPAVVERKTNDTDTEDEDSSDEEFGNDFEFGGLMVSSIPFIF